MSLAEASAMKLYSARAATEVALEDVQIYAGTDEIQITHIAKDLLLR